ncbi:MAG TPA: cyclopropane-fatty-acyl-phospholipid synthase family protein [Gammaproteobacteria bacterium]
MQPPRPGLLDALAKRVVLQRLAAVADGELLLVDGDERHRFGSCSAALPRRVEIMIRDPRFYGDLLLGGSIGAGEAYMRGAWSTPDLTGLVRLFARNMDLLDGMEGGVARLAAPLRRILHAWRRNTRGGSRRNIAAHYDLGNEFFSLMLDETLMYSSAIFTRPDMTLGEAQVARLEVIAAKLALGPADHVLEIGTGWGGFALYAASRHGCRVTTTTISRKQYELARARIAAAGLGDRIEVLCADYRDLEGRYDKLVSIEMIEAVGHEYYDVFFERCNRLLKPDGAMLLQAITIADHRYDRARKSVDFIQRYIFPGGCIPSVSALSGSIARATDMRIVQLQDIGAHYATTLRKWRENLSGNLERVRALGYDDTFLRMWEFYLCYCEGGFLERTIGDVQMLLVRPQSRLALP